MFNRQVNISLLFSDPVSDGCFRMLILFQMAVLDSDKMVVVAPVVVALAEMVGEVLVEMVGEVPAEIVGEALDGMMAEDLVGMLLVFLHLGMVVLHLGMVVLGLVVVDLGLEVTDHVEMLVVFRARIAVLDTVDCSKVGGFEGMPGLVVVVVVVCVELRQQLW